MGNYNEDSIKVLDDITHIRHRSSMYLDSSRPTLHMFQEILDNSMDELMNGYANTINIRIDYEGNSFTVLDNGRGIPQGINKETNLPTPQVIYTTLNSGGKYDTANYTCSAGTNGVGSVCVNALSESFSVKTWRGSSVVSMVCNKGIIESYEETVDASLNDTSGTEVSCKPDSRHKFIFDKLEDYKSSLEDRIYLLKSLFPSCKFTYNGEEVQSRRFSEFLETPTNPLYEVPIEFSTEELKLSMNWSKDTNRHATKCFCNSLLNANGGDHEKGVYDAITEYFGSNDYTLGLNFVLSVLYTEVTYDTQVKLKAVSKELRTYVKETTVKFLKKHFAQNPEMKDQIEELIRCKRKEIDKKNNKSNAKRNRRSSFLNSLGISGFSDCTTKNREEAELYICEGQSAAGSAIQARDVEKHAILPIRGKIINAITSDVASLLKNTEVATIMSSINAGMFEDVDVRKSRYGKIIIFADADADGKNIACLLLSLFCTMTPDLVDAGYLYLSLPPLYGTYVKKKFVPINDEEKKSEYLKKGYEIQRYKGLGEMNPEQLRISCMEPSTRNLVQIKATPDCYEIVKKIMGGSSRYRKELLSEVGVLVD